MPKKTVSLHYTQSARFMGDETQKFDRRHTVSNEDISAGSSMVRFLGGGERNLQLRARFWLEKQQGIWFGI